MRGEEGEEAAGEEAEEGLEEPLFFHCTPPLR
jgi:hypothetical protein